MSSRVAAAPHRRLAPGDTVTRLVDAAVDEVRAEGYDGLTVRNVAKRAGVAPATAYTYFASKDHLVAEAFWQRLQAVPDLVVHPEDPPAQRVAAAVRDVGRLVAAEPQLAAASTTAVMAAEPDVGAVRDRIGLFMHHRLVEALGEGTRPAVVRALDLAWMGAMVLAGTGNIAYTDLPDRLAEVAELLLGEQT
jgi:AcrR family transcriptional regulator